MIHIFSQSPKHTIVSQLHVYYDEIIRTGQRTDEKINFKQESIPILQFCVCLILCNKQKINSIGRGERSKNSVDFIQPKSKELRKILDLLELFSTSASR